MSQYKIAEFSWEYFPSFKQLFRASFGIDIDIAFLKRLFATGPVAGNAISYIAIDTVTGNVVSHFAALPVQLLIDGEIQTAAQSSAAMTDSGHRKKGLFKLLAEKVHDECKARNITLVFSQPNEASFHPFKNVFGFQQVDTIHRWDMKQTIKTVPVPKLLINTPLAGLYNAYSGRVLKKYEVPPPASFTNPLATIDARILRNAAYLDYKKNKRTHFIQIGKAVLCINLTDVFWIGDINDYELVTPAVLKKIKRLAYVLGYNTISFHLNEKVPQPGFLAAFNKYQPEPSMVYYLSAQYANFNLILTGIDFDTW